MIQLLGVLIFCHFLGDFILPFKRLSNSTLTSIPYSLIHVLLTFVILSLGAGDCYDKLIPGFYAAIFFEYLIISLLVKVINKRFKKHEVFLIEQSYHFIILFIIASLWNINLCFNWKFAYPAMAFSVGLIGITLFSMQLMESVTNDFTSNNDSLKADIESGLTGGGKYIGILERSIIFVFILINQPVAVGFLIAAKSFLRIDSNPKHHKRMEYILVGTLFSFLLAVLFSLLTKLLLLKVSVII